MNIPTARSWLADVAVPVGRVPRPSRDVLHAMYLDEKLSITDMARRLGVRRPKVRSWLGEDGIRIRTAGEQAGPRPSRMQLRLWYVDERQASGQNAKRCGVSVGTVQRWLRDAGLPRRPSGRSMESQGLTPPTAEELKRLVWEEHIPYRQIAGIYGCNPTSVTQWLVKFNIPRPTNWETIRKGQKVELPTPDELRAPYAAGESLKAIADNYPVSWLTIRDLARTYGIEMRPPGWYYGPPLICTDGHQVRSTYEMRVDNWLADHGLDHEVEPRMPFTSNWRADFRVGDTFIEVWGVSGKPAYDEKKAAKIAAFRRHRAKLIELPHWIFAAKHDSALERRLAQLLCKPDVT